MSLLLKIQKPDGSSARLKLEETASIKDLLDSVKSLSSCDHPQIYTGYPPQKVIYTNLDERITDHGILSGTVVLVRESPKIVRRIIAADNSCLFNAVAYVRTRSRNFRPDEMRNMIACEILRDIDKYSAYLVDKTADEYASWIKVNTNWGGEIELSILCEYYEVEIAVVNVEAGNMYVYGRDRGFTSRHYLLFDGIHYDALARAAGEGESGDVTEFRPDDETVEMQCLEMAQQLKRQNKFTNVSSFSLVCMICGEGLVGQEGAVLHAKTTGHENFRQAGN